MLFWTIVALFFEDRCSFQPSGSVTSFEILPKKCLPIKGQQPLQLRWEGCAHSNWEWGKRKSYRNRPGS